jgi:hypothetical protein
MCSCNINRCNIFFKFTKPIFFLLFVLLIRCVRDDKKGFIGNNFFLYESSDSFFSSTTLSSCWRHSFLPVILCNWWSLK